MWRMNKLRWEPDLASEFSTRLTVAPVSVKIVRLVRFMNRETSYRVFITRKVSVL